MCDKCKKKSCSGGCDANSMADMQSQLDTLSGFIDNLNAITKFLNGHPILALNDPADIAQFDFTSGKGAGDWLGWGICNGTNYPAAVGFIATPDLRDRFLVGALGTYPIDNVGGANSVTLTIPQMPVHNHTLTDPGHTHIVTDPGHDHNVTDPGHVHAATAANHQHTFTTDADGLHQHTYFNEVDIAGTDYYIPQLIATHQMDFKFSNDLTSASGVHTHTGITDMAVTAITVAIAYTGIDMDLGYTGISNQDATTGITIDPEGGGLPHENRPPWYALLFVKKIF